jgi:hypothetical protein
MLSPRALAALVLFAIGCGDDAAPPIDAPPGPEANCFDGLDNNGDLRVDCADPTCAAVTVCVAPIPTDWNGYAAIFDDATISTDCPAPYATRMHEGFSAYDAPAITCSACTCGAPSGGACEPAGGAEMVLPATFTDRHVFHGNLTDSRACTPCACGAESGGACPASGGAPTGTLTPTEPITYCCTP